MLLYNYNPPIVKETDSEPDPLYNPNEITRVKDILDLHKRGISVSRPINSRGPLEDSREDIVKLSSPNLESDKLFPSIPRVVAQNAHYKTVLEQRKVEFEHLLALILLPLNSFTHMGGEIPPFSLYYGL